jgi:hypothetical protein
MILIGGSGSTGSSLLQNILNRHADIFAGPETRLFIYPHLFDNWNKYKKRLNGDTFLTIRSRGWSMRGRADLLQKSFKWEKADLVDILKHTQSINEFSEAFFKPALKAKKAKIWIEKTPQNACSFYTFLNHYPKGKVVQTLRNPYDVMASLLARGFNAYEAAGYFIYHTCAAASNSESDRYFQIHYEDLVQNPASTIEALLSFLELPYDASILYPTDSDMSNPLKLKGWNHSERGKIAKSSVGRFQKLDENARNEIICALNSFKISERHIKRNLFKFSTFKQFCNNYNYEYLDIDTKPYQNRLKNYHKQDIWTRTRKLHPTHAFYYPGDLDFG